MTSEAFKVGDVVALEVAQGGWQAHRVIDIKRLTVAKVGKIHLVTDDGRKWRLDGRLAGVSYGPRIALWTAETDAALAEVRRENRRERIAYRLGDVVWRSIPLETLEAVEKLIPPATKEAPK